MSQEAIEFQLRMAARSNSRPLSMLCSDYSPGILVASSRIATSFAKSGARNLKSTANISAFMSPTFARMLKAILQVQVSSRPSREIGYRFIQ